MTDKYDNQLLNSMLGKIGLMSQETIANAHALKQMAQELSAKGVVASRDGDNAMMVHKNFMILGNADYIGWMCAVWKDLIINLVNLENPNKMYFVVNADAGKVEIGFDLYDFGLREEQQYNMRFQEDLAWIRALLINGEGDGMFLRLQFMDAITQEEFARINDEESLLSVAYEVLERKAKEIIDGAAAGDE